VVYLLSHGRHINEAIELIYKNIVEPDAFAWSSLLSACKIYNNKEMTECAEQLIFKLNPCVPYELLSNIYTNVEKLSNMRKMH